MNFVILSNQRYFQENKTNKWHTATRLAKMGHSVIFVDPPLRVKALYNFFFSDIKKDLQGVKLLRQFRPSPLRDITRTFPILDYLFAKYTSWRIKKCFGENFILWVYHVAYPNLESLIKNLKPTAIIYDMVDEYTEFPEYKNVKEWVRQRENWLLKKADICFTTAPVLFEKAKKINKNSFFTPNAGDFLLFSQKTEVMPDDLKNIPHPKVGFAGALDDFKVDIGLIKHTAEKLPNISFVLIGGQKVSSGSSFDSESLKKLKNVYLLGQKKFIDLPSYYHHFDAYFIPYVLNEYTIGGCFPVKFFEALSCGLLVTVTNLPAYQNYKNVCNIAKDSDEFVRMVKDSVKDDTESRRIKRIIVAKENSYENKVKKQLEVISKFITT
jgi:glycosyltransferase involved in cell wall biosynthesis